MDSSRRGPRFKADLERLEELHEVLHLIRGEGARRAVWRPAAARIEAIGQRLRTAGVEERRTPRNAHERRDLERAAGSDVDRTVVREHRARVAPGAPLFADR